MNLVKESDWITVFESTDEYQIRIQLLKLESEEIPAIIFDQRDSSYNAFGLIFLKVPRDQYEIALKILNLDHE